MEINDDVPPHSDGPLFQEVGPKPLFKSCVNPEARSVHDRKTSATKRDAEKSATAGFLRFSASRLSLHRSERLVIIGLLRDLGHQFGIDDFAVPVDDHHRTSQQPFQRAIGHQHAVALIERGFPEIRHGNDILDSLDRAKTRMSERQVFRNGQHDRSRQLRREFVELTHRRGANARIEARKNIQDHLLSTQILQRKGGKIGLDQFEIGSRSSCLDKFTGNLHRLSFELRYRHIVVSF